MWKSEDELEVKLELHVQFLRYFLRTCPEEMTFTESIKPTLLLFVISGLDLLDAVDEISESDKRRICDWIYSHQIIFHDGEDAKSGFEGSSVLNFGKEMDKSEKVSVYKGGNLAITFSCLCILIILGDNLSRVDRKAILKAVKALQNENGSFLSSLLCGESDMRFTYCACAICFILNDFSYINLDKAVGFVLKCINYDGGIGQEPELESHAGSAFCALAALQISGKLDVLSDCQTDNLQKWLIFRQDTGFAGRPNKLVDTCYSFWTGAGLKILEAFHLTNGRKNKRYIVSTQDNVTGGFGKWPSSDPDVMHTYFGLCGLSLLGEPGLQPMHAAFNMSQRAYDRLLDLREGK